MGAGRSFDDALAQVQAEGYAEADPSNDVDGWDAASKAAALANVAMDAGITPADVERERLTDVPLERIARARAGGRRLRLVTSVWREAARRRRTGGRGGCARRPRPRPAARRGSRHRAPARGPHRRVSRRGAAHRPDGRRPRERAARAGAADRLRRLRGPAPPVPDELSPTAGGAAGAAGRGGRRPLGPAAGAAAGLRHRGAGPDGPRASPPFLAARPARLADRRRRRVGARGGRLPLRADLRRAGARDGAHRRRLAHRRASRP